MEIAKLYLRTADVTNKTSCGIYKIKAESGRESYKIFPSEIELREYLSKNKDKVCDSMRPVFKNEGYKEFSGTQIRKLTKYEAEKYLSERT